MDTVNPWPIEKCPCLHPACTSWMAGPTLHAEATLTKEEAKLISMAPVLLKAAEDLIRYNSQANLNALIDAVKKAK